MIRWLSYAKLGISVLCLFFVSALEGYSQAVGERVGPQFPFLTSSARAAAMADASAALLDEFSGVSSNPATLGFLRTSRVGYTTQRLQKGITFEHLGVAFKITPVDGIALSVGVLHFGGTDFYTKTSVRDLGYELQSGFSYGRMLGQSLSLGINLHVLTSTTGPTSVWSFGGNLGLCYAPEKYIRYGFYLSGISSDYKVVAPILRTDVFTNRISRVLGMGIAIDFPFDARRQRIVVSAQNEKVLGERVLLYRLGMEYYPLWSDGFRCALRAGLLVREPDAAPRLGLGLAYADLSLDYAYGYIRRYNQPTHMFHLSLAW